MKILLSLLFCGLTAAAGLADDTIGPPSGYLPITLLAGTGTARKITAVSVPLYSIVTSLDGALSGTITALTSSTVTNAAATWTAGQLSHAATPCVLKFTSGTAAGRVFLLSVSTSNTADTVTLASGQADLVALGVVAGDGYQLYFCDTLLSLFGTPSSTGILGGASAAAADTVTLVTEGTSQTYYYDTSLGRWTQAVAGTPDASNIPLPPDAGVLYGRLSSSGLSLVVGGRASDTLRVAVVNASGTTILSSGFPVGTTIAASGIAQIPGWSSAASSAAADKVQLYSNGTLYTYWYDGANWRRQTLGSPISNSVSIPAGSAIVLMKVGSATGTTTLTQALPYSAD